MPVDLSSAAQQVIEPLLGEYKEDRRRFPLWTYDDDAWASFEAPWVERSAWAPAERATILTGQASGFWRYLHQPVDGIENRPYLARSRPPEDGSVGWEYGPFTTLLGKRPVRWVEDFEEWPLVRICEPVEDGQGVRYKTVKMPWFMQAHVAGLYAAMGSKVPDSPTEIHIPDPPNQLDVEEMWLDLKRVLLTDDPEVGKMSLAERIIQDYSRRTMLDERGREFVDRLRKERPTDSRSSGERRWLRQPYSPEQLGGLLVRESGLYPGLPGGAKSSFKPATVLALVEQARQLVQTFRDWEPSTDLQKRMVNLVLKDPNWSFEPKDKLGFDHWRSALRTGTAHEKEPPARKIVDLYLRWLRFPYLDSPSPSLIDDESRVSHKHLVRRRMRGDPSIETLNRYLRKAQSS